MGHNDPAAGLTIDGDWAFDLDRSGSYTPDLVGLTTDPDLGADGEAVGWFQRNGHMITGGARFLFSGAGLDPGSGTLQITLPFDPDESTMEASGTTAGGTIIGAGFIRDNSTGANSRTVVIQLGTDQQVSMKIDGTNNSVSDSNAFTWAEGDRIAVQFTYLADATAL